MVACCGKGSRQYYFTLEEGGVGNEPVSPHPRLNARGIHDFNNNKWNCESIQRTMVSAEQSGWSWGTEAILAEAGASDLCDPVQVT